MPRFRQTLDRRQRSLFAQPDFLRVEIVKTLALVFNQRQLPIPCPLCGGPGWAFVIPIADPRTSGCPWSWICEKCFAMTGSHIKDRDRFAPAHSQPRIKKDP